MRKRVIAALLTAALTAGVLPGCGEPKKRVNEDGESVITIWSPSDEPAIEEWWVEKIEAFNQAHEGTIELRREAIVRADSYAYEDKVNAAITSNDLPDILYVDGPNVSIYAANEVTLPLDDFFSEEEWSDFLTPPNSRIRTMGISMQWVQRKVLWHCTTIKTCWMQQGLMCRTVKRTHGPAANTLTLPQSSQETG